MNIYTNFMEPKTLRELQLRGENAISDSTPTLLTNRRGPVAILVPVNEKTLPAIQAEAEKWMAAESLRQTWKLAKDAGLDALSMEEIDVEVKKVRRLNSKKR